MKGTGNAQPFFSRSFFDDLVLLLRWLYAQESEDALRCKDHELVDCLCRCGHACGAPPPRAHTHGGEMLTADMRERGMHAVGQGRCSFCAVCLPRSRRGGIPSTVARDAAYVQPRRDAAARVWGEFEITRLRMVCVGGDGRLPGELVLHTGALPPEARSLPKLPWVRLLLDADPTIKDPNARFTPTTTSLNALHKQLRLMR